MAVFLIKAIFSILTELLNIISRVIFTALAFVLVQLIQALRAPAEGSQRILEQAKNGIRACLEYLVDFVVEAISAVISSLFGFVKDGVFNSSSGFLAAVTGLMEKLKTSLEGVVEEIPELLNVLTEMVGKIVTDFLSNCNDAIAYVSENVLN